MKNRRTILTTAILIVLIASLVTAFAQNGRARFKPGDMTIADIAVSNPNFSTLVAALSCTGLVGAVADPEAELTVFAPPNGAFEKIGLDADNVCDIDTQTLTTILLYHVVGERRPSPSVINGKNKNIEMLAGGSIYPEGKGSLSVFDNGGNEVMIMVPDVLASNGIIHIVDNVLLP